jgi:signal transduction histidine kinase
VARHASRSRRILAALGGFATLAAFGLAALLFARMRAARRSSALRTDFVAAVSHELRTPIASMRMLAELLEESRVEPEEQREVFEALARESRRLGETVDRLLGFSRMAAGRYVIERAEARVAGPVAASIDTFEERNPELPRVEREIDEGLAASIDAAQIRLAVDNLLANAKKYAPGGTPYRVSVRRDAGGVAVTVADRGPGIARRDQGRIFEPFERADDRLSRATEGSGIGLSLVQHVARAHAGRAFVASEPGRGAAFTIWIPLTRSSRDDREGT